MLPCADQIRGRGGLCWTTYGTISSNNTITNYCITDVLQTSTLWAKENNSTLHATKAISLLRTFGKDCPPRESTTSLYICLCRSNFILTWTIRRYTNMKGQPSRLQAIEREGEDLKVEKLRQFSGKYVTLFAVTLRVCKSPVFLSAC
jgi:hypothetical protein